MKKHNKFLVFIGIIISIATCVSAICTVLLIRKKHQQEEEDLENYLDYSIQ